VKPPQGPPLAALLLRGVWRENPVLVATLGLCPALAVTNTVANSLTMGLATLCVLTCSSLLVSIIRTLVPHQVRISTYILIIATFVTLADMVLEAIVPGIHRALGAFIALIVVNCMILGRQESFASKNPIGRSVLDALGVGAGFTLTLLMMGLPRELLGSGSILGVDVMGPNFEPWVIMILPPGGFLMIGLLLIGKNWWALRTARPKPERLAAMDAARHGAPPRGRQSETAPEQEGALV
jgi:Na+-translocating ferredoxin:NAD+ oxidoreductase subunit E